MRARDQSSIFSTGGKFRPDYGLLLELHALTLVAHSYVLLYHVIHGTSITHHQVFHTQRKLWKRLADLAFFTSYKDGTSTNRKHHQAYKTYRLEGGPKGCQTTQVSAGTKFRFGWGLQHLHHNLQWFCFKPRYVLEVGLVSDGTCLVSSATQ